MSTLPKLLLACLMACTLAACNNTDKPKKVEESAPASGLIIR